MTHRLVFILLWLSLAPCGWSASITQQLHGRWEGVQDGKTMALVLGENLRGQLVIDDKPVGVPGSYFTYEVDESAYPVRLQLVAYIGDAPVKGNPLRFLVRFAGPDQIELAMVDPRNDAATFDTTAPKDRMVMTRVASNGVSKQPPPAGRADQPPTRELLAALRRTDQYYTGYARYISALQRLQKSPEYAEIAAIDSKGLSEEEIRKSMSKANIEYLYALAAREDYLLSAIMTAVPARVASIEAHCGREKNAQMIEKAESLYWKNQHGLPLDEEDRANRIQDYKEKYELYRLQPVEIDALECQAHTIKFEGMVKTLLGQLDKQDHPELSPVEMLSLYEARFK